VWKAVSYFEGRTSAARAENIVLRKNLDIRIKYVSNYIT
jgi:hypothetical protein